MPYFPQTHGLTFNIRLSDLAAADVLRVQCPSCGYQLSVAPHQPLARLLDFKKLVELEPVMRCTWGQRRGAMRVISIG